MIKIFKNRNGTSTVFLMLIISSLVLLVFTFFRLTLGICGIGYSDGVLNLAGRSVLSEFNLNLKDDYGIFAFAGFEHDISEKLYKYAITSFKSKKYWKLGKLSSDTQGYRLGDTEVFENEIEDYSKYAFARGLFKDFSQLKHDQSVKPLEDVNKGRTLRNTVIINSLPSEGRRGKVSLPKNIEVLKTGIKGLFSKGEKKYLVNRYILNKFKNRQNQSTGLDTFFKYEIEYILFGKKSDKKNALATRKMLIGTRNLFNLAYIWSNPSMRKKVLGISEVLTPGPQSALTAIAVAEAWAFAESKNDMRILEKGGRVPLTKSRRSWAISAKNIPGILKHKKTKYTKTSNKDGLLYQQYLQILLLFEESQIKYQRMMDLMQINIQGKYDRDFLIKEHNAGFLFDAEVGGKQYEYEEKY